jgi:hypothetical protein
MPRVLTSRVRVSIQFRCRMGQVRPQCRPWTDMTKWLQGGVTRGKTIDGVGSWSADFKVRYLSSDWDFFDAVLRDDDWVAVTFRDAAAESVMVGVVDHVQFDESVNDGAIERRVTVSGRDWGRCMQSGLRCTAMLGAANVEASDFEDALDEGELESLLVGPRSEPDQLNRRYPRIPGVIDDPLWNALMQYLADNLHEAWVPLEKVLRVMLWGQWRDPDGATLLYKLGRNWSRFGQFAGQKVEGAPWQMSQFVPKSGSTPDGFLKAYANAAFNEVFYEYADGDRSQPAVVFRPRPYSGPAWRWLVDRAIRLDDRMKLRLNLSRSGVERYNYLMPVATIGGLTGVDLYLDTRAGYLPLIDRSQIPAHGLRAADPRDDYYPPIARYDSDVLDYYRQRTEMFRDWYYYAGEFFTGQVTCVPALPAARIGTCVIVPTGPRTWRQQPGDQIVKRNELVGYVVGVSDRAVMGDGGALQTSTTLSIIRGQPVDGLLAPNIETWRTP